MSPPLQKLAPFLNAVATLLLALTTSTPAFAVERGAWFWFQSGDPYGAANIVGSAAKEDETIAYLQGWQVKRLYGSYSNLPTTSAVAMAAWNKKLALAGIDSYNLALSDATQMFPAQQTSVENIITSRFVSFNNGRTDPLERFSGVEVDLEPHTLTNWSSGTPSDRRTLLLNLRDTFANVRNTMNSGGYTSAPLNASLPVWYDSSSTIGWLDTPDRDQWFTDIGVSLDAVSLMAYETASITSILNSVAYEQSHFDGDVHIALRSKLGDEWTTYDDFKLAVQSVETQTAAGIDIESYYRLRQIEPAPATAGDFNNDGLIDAADYILWRTGGPIANETVSINAVDLADYAAWRSAFGNTHAGTGLSSSTHLVPEPAALCLTLLAVFTIARRRQRPTHCVAV